MFSGLMVVPPPSKTDAPSGTLCQWGLLSRHSVLSDSLWPHGLQHARLLCPSLSPSVCSRPCPLSRWCHPTLLTSVVPSSCPQSFPASGSFSMSRIFASSGQSTGASASVLPMNIQVWFPLELTGLISLLTLSKGDSWKTLLSKQVFWFPDARHLALWKCSDLIWIWASGEWVCTLVGTFHLSLIWHSMPLYILLSSHSPQRIISKDWAQWSGTRSITWGFLHVCVIVQAGPLPGTGRADSNPDARLPGWLEVKSGHLQHVLAKWGGVGSRAAGGLVPPWRGCSGWGVPPRASLELGLGGADQRRDERGCPGAGAASRRPRRQSGLNPTTQGPFRNPPRGHCPPSQKPSGT